MKLKIFRIIFSAIIFILFIYAILFTNKLTIQLTNLLTYTQFLPGLIKLLTQGLYAGSVVFIFIIVLTFIFGRFYCSFLCPLGIMQDIISSVRNIFKIKYRFVKPLYPLNYAVLFITLFTAITGFYAVMNFLDPYSIFTRINTNLAKPFLSFAVNKFFDVLKGFKIYSSYFFKLHKSNSAFIILSLFYFLLIAFLSIFKGRLYCNTICPVGTLLGIMSRYSMFKILIKNENCVNCRKCEIKCKGGCIDSKNEEIDHSRCVLCFNCLDQCGYQAIDYRNVFTGEKIDEKRRAFLLKASPVILGALTAPSLFLRNKINSGILNKLRDKKNIIPPGSMSLEHYSGSCISCHLCISTCPAKVLTPVLLNKGKSTLQPVLDYNYSYCDYECSLCSQVCPTGAIKPVSLNDKKLIQIGYIDLNRKECIAWSLRKDCAACSEHCPTKAVYMIPDGDIYVPVTNTDICTGCGACEHVCPSKPVRAIKIIAHDIHKKAKKPETSPNEVLKNFKKIEEQKESIKKDDFPF